MAKVFNLTEDQIKRLTNLWFIYGNGGKKCTKGNHGYIQGILEYDEDRKGFYLDGIQNMRDNGVPEDYVQSSAITLECIEEVDKILNNKP